MNRGRTSKYHQGKYIPINPAKYKGDLEKIFARSSWEFKAFKFLDTNPNVIQWTSECVVVPYISPVDNRQHRYFVDLYFRIKTKDGDIIDYVAEIKPLIQTKVPEKTPKKSRERYIEEVKTYVVNEAKWKAAKKYCDDRGWKFTLITENDLGLTKKNGR